MKVLKGGHQLEMREHLGLKFGSRVGRCGQG